jgi:hypothetical protein
VSKRTSFKLSLDCGHRIYRPRRSFTELCSWCGNVREVVRTEPLHAVDGPACPRGHNAVWQLSATGRRYCLSCHAEDVRKYRERRKLVPA